jgi:hypothetical protein
LLFNSDKKKKGKKMGDSLSSFFGSIGLKKGKNLKVAAAELYQDKDAAIFLPFFFLSELNSNVG